jgi:hypothetical protein
MLLIFQELDELTSVIQMSKVKSSSSIIPSHV